MIVPSPATLMKEGATSSLEEEQFRVKKRGWAIQTGHLFLLLPSIQQAE